ncbi:MAG: hypothetical protein ACR2PY_00380 [Salinispira sp.]
MNFIIAGIITAALCYLIIPGAGALVEILRWRTFRRLIIDAGYLPIYAEGDPTHARYRFFGELEAIEGKDIVWLNDGKRRVRINLKNRIVYNLPGGSFQTEEGSIRYSKWQNFSSLSEGIRFFVAGMLTLESDLPVFGMVSDDDLIVVIHDVGLPHFISQVMRAGRQNNPYWSAITAPSLLVGMLVEFLLLLFSIRNLVNSSQFITLSFLAILPALILMPPGIFFFLLYRRYWRFGYRYFIEADLLKLPHSWVYETQEGSDSFAGHVYTNGNSEELLKKIRKRAVGHQVLALLFFIIGLFINNRIVESLLLLFWFL